MSAATLGTVLVATLARSITEGVIDGLAQNSDQLGSLGKGLAEMIAAGWRTSMESTAIDAESPTETNAVEQMFANAEKPK